ncbi:MAG: ribonuclease P protein component [Burkholderiales bacterium]|nr:ribonuclease P protein component [Burkholderiales bacterium]
MADATTARRLGAADISAVLKSPQRARSAHFALFWRDAETWGLGMVVSKKLAGNAVLRNRVKRQTRAAFRGCRAAVTAAGAGRRLEAVLRVTADVRRLDRAAQFAELSGLFARCGATAPARRS